MNILCTVVCRRLICLPDEEFYKKGARLSDAPPDRTAVYSSWFSEHARAACHFFSSPDQYEFLSKAKKGKIACLRPTDLWKEGNEKRDPYPQAAAQLDDLFNDILRNGLRKLQSVRSSYCTLRIIVFSHRRVAHNFFTQ
eukprot:TRINITY_DN955_c0_g1_i1.p1 TRINITY_DN955_c0_g1~~TRINITY_DN955_c0_g1_i1.p1  ORF type:complete len:139 (+),score=12.44 TRINITY_DN955_c0_g1_i1:493-909(+)